MLKCRLNQIHINIQQPPFTYVRHTLLKTLVYEHIEQSRVSGKCDMLIYLH